MTDDLIPVIEGDPKPDGYMGIVDQHGQRWWMRLDALKRKSPTTPLSEEQIERIRAFKEILSEHDRTSVAQAIDNFRRDNHPEPQIQIWEAVGAAYRAELRDRPWAEETERKLVFRALLQATFWSLDAAAAVSHDPTLADLPDLDRVLARYRTARAGSSAES